MIKLASHNSWSYAKPQKWYIPRFPVRCLSLNIPQQYQQGVRLFDLRLRLDSKLHFATAHGSCIFRTYWSQDLLWLNIQQESIYVRVTLEYNHRPKNAEYIIARFRQLCMILESRYPSLHFFGGRAKWSWEVLYTFSNSEPLLLDRYSSTTSWFRSSNRILRIIDDWWPWLYARFHNRRNYQNYIHQHPDDESTTPWLFLDFITPHLTLNTPQKIHIERIQA